MISPRVFGTALVAVLAGCATAGPNATTSSTSKKKDNVIMSAEFDSLSLRNAYDIVERLRPTWFTRAGQAATSTMGISVSGSNRGVQTSGGSGIVVFMDNTRMGGLSALEEITPASIASIEFMDVSTAQARLPNLRGDVISGAIVVHSQGVH